MRNILIECDIREGSQNLRPDVDRLVVEGEGAEDRLLDGPFAAVVIEDEFVVLQEGPERVVADELVPMLAARLRHVTAGGAAFVFQCNSLIGMDAAAVPHGGRRLGSHSVLEPAENICSFVVYCRTTPVQRELRWSTHPIQSIYLLLPLYQHRRLPLTLSYY